ncbi:MAG TPA: lipoprotein-releasing ABC transporter permease subunit [Steroidobacteraceae bacterium]|nr:lipoprotein-releasing ABC transporter permease subunit [Steroidobacteraceae bacterium]
MSEASAKGGAPRWPAWVGLRYLRARKDNRFVGFISAIAMAGIALGVTVLITVLSVMNGFERDLSRRILDIVAHATLEGLEGRLPDWRALAEQTARASGVVAVAPYVEGRAMLVAGERSAAVDLRAVQPEAERRVSALESHVSGRGFDELRPGEWRILLGRGLAQSLGVGPGDGVLAVIAQGTVTPAGVMPRMRRFTVAGTLDAGMYEFDQGLALVDMRDAQRLFRLGDAVTGLRYRFEDANAAGARIRAIGQLLPEAYYINDWSRRQGNFFRSLQVTKSIMFFVLMLVVAVAAFNIIATLVMVVKEKRADIAILRTLGGSPRDMVAIFVTQGSVIGVAGTAVGLALGLLLAANITPVVSFLQRVTGVTLVDPRVYFIAELPSDIHAGDVALVAGLALALGVLATLYPAWRAATTQPAEALRHEV